MCCPGYINTYVYVPMDVMPMCYGCTVDVLLMYYECMVDVLPMDIRSMY